MDVKQLKQDVCAGRVDSHGLLELIVEQGNTIAEQAKRISKLEDQLDTCLAHLEEAREKLEGNPTPRVDESYSVEAEERRRNKKNGKKKLKRKRNRRGRISSEEKIKLASREENVYPEGVDRHTCRFSHTRPIWRIIDGKAMIVAYHIYRRGNLFGQVEQAVGRCEYGMEVLLSIAHLVYVVGISLDKACEILGFFQDLNVSKAQANALLNRLAKHWEDEFNTLCDIIAKSAVVYTDETSWSLNSVWAFITAQAQVVFHGVHKDSETLDAILILKEFTGTIVSDDAAVYRNLTKAQKCWAHLLRKSIRIALTCPNEEYRRFTDQLLDLYHEANRIKDDGRLSVEGRQQKVIALQDQLTVLCKPRWLDSSPTAKNTPEHAHKLLVNELMRLLDDDELFTFVTDPNVDGTNNLSERTLRPAAEARKTGRTNKSFTGARRQTIILSVLRSLGKQLASFQLGEVIREATRWTRVGRSCFQEIAKKMGIEPREASVLDTLLPLPSEAS